MEELKLKIALIEQRHDAFSEKLEALDAGHKDIHALIRKFFFTVALSFLATLGYLAKGIVDKVG